MPLKDDRASTLEIGDAGGLTVIYQLRSAPKRSDEWVFRPPFSLSLKFGGFGAQCFQPALGRRYTINVVRDRSDFRGEAVSHLTHRPRVVSQHPCNRPSYRAEPSLYRTGGSGDVGLGFT
ncbi:MAG: hypothetical protein ACRDZT_09355, partial [Acidimicrobiales bacterium]